MRKISILVPCKNEQETVGLFLEAFAAAVGDLPYEWEFVFVNDGSKDNTLEVLSELAQTRPGIKIVDLSRNFGKEIALTAALDHATGDAAIPMDADLQDPPELISEMTKLWEQGYDVVYAVRSKRHGEGLIKKATAYIFYRLIALTSRTEIPADTGDFRLIDRRVIDALKQQRETHRYMKGLFAWIGFRQIGIPYERKPRSAGKTKFNFFKLVELAIEGITSFSTGPLRLATVFGLLISVGAMVYASVLIALKVLYGNEAEGYTSLMVAVLFMGGIQLVFLGILGEYVGRIFNESKQRSLYLVREVINS
jgi:polyisoprenyl-phosphate glycosyltransferase